MLLQNGGIKADPVADYTLYFDRYTVPILSEGLLTDTRPLFSTATEASPSAVRSRVQDTEYQCSTVFTLIPFPIY